jgi:hypothetical protein
MTIQPPKAAAPDHEWLTLTEAVTEAIGERLTDIELHARQVHFDAKCQSEWGDFVGPGWLLQPLELVLQRKERSWQSRKSTFLEAYDNVAEAAHE